MFLQRLLSDARLNADVKTLRNGSDKIQKKLDQICGSIKKYCINKSTSQFTDSASFFKSTTHKMGSFEQHLSFSESRAAKNVRKSLEHFSIRATCSEFMWFAEMEHDDFIKMILAQRAVLE